MPSAANEIVIARPPAQVFEFLADRENDLRWRSGIVDLERISGSGVGARYAQGVRGPGGRRIEADIEITEFTPAHAIAFQTIAGPVRPRGRYLLTAADKGTRVRFELEADVRGLKRLMAPMVQKTMDNEVRQLDELKRVIEAR
jgi:carbon monoxide dehydrogenase subunit G